MKVQFRDFDQFDLWIWLKFYHPISPREKEYIEELFSSWFLLGKLGGFNAENLQVQDVGIDLNYMEYDQEYADRAMMSVMHNMGEVEYKNAWARCWFDLGTSDAIALDVLINALKQLSVEYVEIEKLIIGGENEDWTVERRADFAENEN